ncbi:MAG: hypothetical protein V3U88_08130, partial [Methylococcales bacterium]
GFLFLTEPSQKAHSHSTQRLRLRWSGAKRPARLVTLFRQTTLNQIMTSTSGSHSVDYQSLNPV